MADEHLGDGVVILHVLNGIQNLGGGNISKGCTAEFQCTSLIMSFTTGCTNEQLYIIMYVWYWLTIGIDDINTTIVQSSLMGAGLARQSNMGCMANFPDTTRDFLVEGLLSCRDL